MKALALALVSTMLTGCVGAQYNSGSIVQPKEQGASSSGFTQFLRALAGPGPGLAAHDPQNGSALFEQIPNWDGAAMKVCCSALGREEFLRMRCDTDQPVYPRTNRC